MKKYLVTTIVTLWLLSGCAIVYEGKYKFSDGWRDATVVNEGEPDSSDFPLEIDCRQSQALSHGEQYVTVCYSFQNAHRRNAVFKVSQGVRLKPGEQIYVNVFDCDQTVKKHP